VAAEANQQTWNDVGTNFLLFVQPSSQQKNCSDFVLVLIVKPFVFPKFISYCFT
jgi:hypothetical protein